MIKEWNHLIETTINDLMRFKKNYFIFYFLLVFVLPI
jgi:hypothetical protein